MNEYEGFIIKQLNKKGYDHFPKLLSIGVKQEKPYLILERMGKTLEFYQMINKNKFSFTTVNLIGIQMVTLIEQIHSIGYIYNDLKPDNICVGSHNNIISYSKLKLIDFGIASCYI